VFLTCFNAGLRVYDLVDPESPREVAAFVPGPNAGAAVPQTDDVVVREDGIVFLTDRAGGGVHVLELER
jgi:hypothetical protein